MQNPQPEKTFIRNKAAQVFALLFVTEYLTKWPKFFFDILSVVDLNPRGVDLYLRILMAIDSELVDRDVVHTSEASGLECMAGVGGGHNVGFVGEANMTERAGSRFLCLVLRLQMYQVP